jgi:thioredoxin-disulfide reductase
MSDPTYDVVVIGGGCAGFSAALYAARRNLKTLVITKDIGGQIATTSEVENYPGIDRISGPELALKMQDQALKWGASLLFDEITNIQKIAEQNFEITGNSQTYHARSIILAYGKTPRNLDVPGEQKYLGRGVSYCVTCDAPLYKNRTVAIVGGGNSALEGALICSEIAQKVYLIHRRASFRGEEVILDKTKQTTNLELILESKVSEIFGENGYLKALKLESTTNEDQFRTLEVDGVFVEIGFIINNQLTAGLVEIDESKQILTDNLQQTSCSGILAAGDVTNTPYKQAVISASEGAKAALSAYTYLKGSPAPVDWSGH